MAAKTVKLRPWTKEDVWKLKTLGRALDNGSGDRTETQAQRGSDVRQGSCSRCVSGHSSEEVRGR